MKRLSKTFVSIVPKILFGIGILNACFAYAGDTTPAGPTPAGPAPGNQVCTPFYGWATSSCNQGGALATQAQTDTAPTPQLLTAMQNAPFCLGVNSCLALGQLVTTYDNNTISIKQSQVGVTSTPNGQIQVQYQMPQNYPANQGFLCYSDYTKGGQGYLQSNFQLTRARGTVMDFYALNQPQYANNNNGISYTWSYSGTASVIGGSLTSPIPLTLGFPSNVTSTVTLTVSDGCFTSISQMAVSSASRAGQMSIPVN